ncbi:MAG: hypothetical protein IOD05_19720 [Rhodobacter sp.]|jgi:hypothetical protein|nr:hypothetical protein [Rhodobacter sp.]MCA3486992.1 hypothetical protein [Rhodobacter sp.]MCA3492513.1 hypothetical protein [Rhodobacter sp.]MCA3498808.1 hypothetical protein [Rhodobacter sp.]MCA3505435.1 hypothetical protein [Rhodobacter sp.]
MSGDLFLFGVPFLSLGTVLIALSMMAPAHPLSWLWRTLCVVASVPPILTGFLFFGVPFAAFLVSVYLSAPFAAAMSLAVAVRLRRSA